MVNTGGDIILQRISIINCWIADLSPEVLNSEAAINHDSHGDSKLLKVHNHVFRSWVPIVEYYAVKVCVWFGAVTNVLMSLLVAMA